MAFKMAAVLALTLGSAQALQVLVKGQASTPLFEFHAKDVMEARASWGGGLGTVSYMPDWLAKDGVLYYEVPGLLTGETLELQTEGATCEMTMYVAVYACGNMDCEGRVHGGLPALLAEEGWTMNEPGPRFMLPFSGQVQHNTKVWSKTAAAGATLATPVAQADAMYVGAFVASCDVASVPTPSGPSDNQNVGPSQNYCATRCPVDGSGNTDGGESSTYSYDYSYDYAY